MTMQARSSAASRCAIWEVLPTDPPGIDAFAVRDAAHIAEGFVRATLHDLLVAGAIRCAKRPITLGRNSRERTHYWRAMTTLPSFEQAQTMQGRKTRMCLSCRREFSSWGAGNRICSGCSSRSDPLPDVVVAGARW